MYDLKRAVGEFLLSDLECPVCMQYMVPPIRLCTNGHNICSKCRGRVQCCPTCRAEFSEIRCLALEDIARRVKYPCANRQRGCLEFFSIEHINEHHAVCVYGKIKCPLHLFKTCSWNGLKNDLKEHAKAAHAGYFFEVSAVKSSVLLVKDCVAVASCFGELFTYSQQKKDDRYNFVVQLIGTRSEASKYKCKFTLRAANGIEKISNTFFVQGYSEDFETIFNSRNCLSLDEETINRFGVDGKHNLTVTLSTV